MTGFRVDRFSGERPLLNARKMPPGSAREAYDCDLVAADLRPFRTTKEVAVASTVSTNRTGFVFQENQMFLFEEEVDATFGPLQAASDVKNRVFIGSGFQAYPVWSNKEIGFPTPSGTYHGRPIAWRKLGVPAGSTAPIVTLSSIPNGFISGITIADGKAVVACVFDHLLAAGDKVLIDGLNTDWSDISGNTFTITPHGTDAKKFFLNNYDPTPHDGSAYTPSGGGTWTQEFNSEDVEDRLYVYTYVTDQGEEGPPSDPSSLQTLVKGQEATITTPTSPTVDGYTVAFKRIYRTQAGTSGSADYFFVDEVAIGSATYLDTKEAIELGEALPSLDWYPPPTGLTGLTVLPNGVMAGFLGRTIYLSEPYQPHAWPSSYTKEMDSEIVGIAAFGQSLVVATEDHPYVGHATDPLSMTFTKLDTVEPCISKRACISLGYGVIYPSPNGLILVTPGGTKNVLTGVWDERDWRALFDGAFTESWAAVHDGRYYLMIRKSGVTEGIVFDPSSESLEISHLTLPAWVYGLLVDRDTDRLYWLRNSSGYRVYQWNPDDGVTFIQARWRSQTFTMPYPVNMGAFQVFFVTPGTVTVDFYADGVLKHTANVTSQEPQRLPSGFLAREWMFEIRSQVEVQGIYVAETIAELRGALAG